MKILETRVYRGPNLYAPASGDPAARRPRRAGGLPDPPAPRLQRAAAGADPHSPRAQLLLRRARRLRPPPDRGRGHLAGARAGARGDRAAVPGRHPRHLRQDAQPQPAARRSTTSSTASWRRASASPPASSPCASSATCCRPSARRTTRSRSTSRPSSRRWCASPSAAPSAPRPPPWCDAAEERDIPWIRLNERSLVQLGHGKYQQRIQATVTSETRHIAVEIASDKRLTNQILERPRAAGAAPGPGLRPPRRRSRPPSAWAIPSWSSRSTATTAAACRSTC